MATSMKWFNAGLPCALLGRQRGQLPGCCCSAVLFVLSRDGQVAQSYVPPTDFRLSYAMETHGVACNRLQPTPSEAQLAPRRAPSEKLQQMFTNVLPAIALVLVYVATQVAAKWKVCHGPTI